MQFLWKWNDEYYTFIICLYQLKAGSVQFLKYFFQIDEPSLNKVMHYIELGIKQNAKLEAGGKRIGKVGYFVEPTVFSNVTDDMSIAKEEVSFLLFSGICHLKNLDYKGC